MTPSIASSSPQTAPAAAAASAEYVPSGKMGPGALPMMWFAALAGAVVVGAFYAWVSQFFNLVIMSELIAGGLAGALIAVAIRAGKCRNTGKAWLCGIVCGLLLYAVNIAVTSELLRRDLVNNSQIPQPTRTAIAQSDPLTMLRFYLSIAAEEGVTLTSSHSSSSAGGIEIKGIWFWLLTLVEAGATVVAAGGVAAGAAGSRFCEACDTWWETKQIQRVHPDRSGEMLRYAQAGDFAGLNAVPVANEKGKKPDDKNYSSATLERCPKCSDGTITIATVLKGAAQPGFKTRIDPQTAANLAAKK